MIGAGRVLVVADGPESLERLQGLFSGSGTAYDVEYFSVPSGALAAITEREFKVVFVELVAGARASTEFLQEVWKVRPESVRFFLAPAVDSELMVSCVLGAHHYLRTPLDVSEFKAALERAECINRLVRNPRIQSLVSRMRTLPSRPSLYLEVIRELRSPTASAHIVGDLVSKDLGISMKLIQVVNSAFYGLAQKVEEPAAAVLLLGLETTASLVLSIEAFSRFDQVKPLLFSSERVWRHSQSVAHSARTIAELMSNDLDVARHAFTAGLVHDIGKLALALNFEEQYQGALKLAEKNKLSPCDVEAEVFGATHAETGAYLLSLWGLPLPIVEAVAGHHLPAAEVGNQFTALTALHIAERLHSEQDQLRDGATEVNMDLAYPEVLQLAPRMDEFRRVVAGRESDDNNGTMIMTRAQLKAVPVPVNVAAAPAPLVEVKADASPKVAAQKRGVFWASIAASILVCGAAITMLSNSKREHEQAVAMEVADYRVSQAARPERLSGRIVQSAPEEKPTAEEPAPAPAAVEFPSVKLQAIIFNGTRSTIVIDGRSFRVGDEVSGARIVAVQPDEVILEKGSAQHSVRLR